MPSNVDLVKSIYQAFGRGDVAAVLGAFDPKIEWREAEGFIYAEGNPYVGPQAVAEGVFQRCVTDVENFSVLPDRFIDGGESVVVEGRYRGKMKATGRPLNAQFAHLWQLRNGKVIEFRQYTDTRQWSDAARS